MYGIRRTRSGKQFQDSQFADLCHRLDEENIDMRECRKKQQKIRVFYTVLYDNASFTTNRPSSRKGSALHNDIYINVPKRAKGET
jgi:hypothetical protein